jgi:hypothetical protein
MALWRHEENDIVEKIFYSERARNKIEPPLVRTKDEREGRNALFHISQAVNAI